MTNPITISVGSASDQSSVLDFIASLIDSLAWPVAVVVIAIVLRRPISGLIKAIRTLSFGDARAEFGEEMNSAEAKAEVLKTEAATSGEPIVPLDQQVLKSGDMSIATPFPRFEKLAVAAPSAAILEIWSVIYRELNKAATAHGIKARNAKGVIDQLALRGVLDSLVVSLLNDLRVMRNSAAHSAPDQPMTVADAIRYRDAANAVLPALTRAAKN